MKKLLLVMLASLFMFTSCDMLFEVEDEQDMSYVGAWVYSEAMDEYDINGTEEYNEDALPEGVSGIMTMALTFTEDTIVMTQSISFSGTDTDAIAMMVFFMGGAEGDTAVELGGAKGTLQVDGNNMTLEFTHTVGVDGAETVMDPTSEMSGAQSGTWSVSGTTLTFIIDGETQTFTKQ